MGCGLCRDDEAKKRNDEIGVKMAALAQLQLDTASVSHVTVIVEKSGTHAKLNGHG